MFDFEGRPLKVGDRVAMATVDGPADNRTGGMRVHRGTVRSLHFGQVGEPHVYRTGDGRAVCHARVIVDCDVLWDRPDFPVPMLQVDGQGYLNVARVESEDDVRPLAAQAAQAAQEAA